ncbi:MAG: prepilin-type N-terminal cleavage/methylation domain-containing protein [Pseudomonadota bacterium]
MNKKKAFSLVEASIVIVIIGVAIAAITQGTRLVQQFRLNSARSLTQSSPVPATDNLVLWLETTSTDSFQSVGYSNNAPLAATSGTKVWYDLSHKNDALSTSNSPYSSNPIYVKKGINSLPSLKFDGVSQYLDFTNPTVLVNGSYTVFVVEQPTKTSGNLNYFLAPKSGGCSTNTCFSLGHENITSGTYTIYLSHYSNYLATTASDISSLTYRTDHPILHSATFSTIGSRKYFYNGTLGKSDSNTIAVNGNNYMTIGNAGSLSGGFYQGLIGEIIIFNRSLDKDERWAIEAYLGKKWGISVNQN